MTPEEQEEAKAECLLQFDGTIGVEFAAVLAVLVGRRIVKVRMVVGQSFGQGALVLTTEEGTRVTITSCGTLMMPPILNIENDARLR